MKVLKTSVDEYLKKQFKTKTLKDIKSSISEIEFVIHHEGITKQLKTKLKDLKEIKNKYIQERIKSKLTIESAQEILNVIKEQPNNNLVLVLVYQKIMKKFFGKTIYIGDCSEIVSFLGARFMFKCNKYDIMKDCLFAEDYSGQNGYNFVLSIIEDEII
jgi:hypothetical protein